MITESKLEFYKTEYLRLSKFINKKVLPKVEHLYKNNFEQPLKHDGSNCSKIEYMLTQLEERLNKSIKKKI